MEESGALWYEKLPRAGLEAHVWHRWQRLEQQDVPFTIKPDDERPCLWHVFSKERQEAHPDAMPASHALNEAEHANNIARRKDAREG